MEEKSLHGEEMGQAEQVLVADIMQAIPTGLIHQITHQSPSTILTVYPLMVGQIVRGLAVPGIPVQEILKLTRHFSMKTVLMLLLAELVHNL